MRSQGYFLSSSDIRSLLGRLDRDNDFQVNISEFEDIFFLGLGLGSADFKQSGFNKSGNSKFIETHFHIVKPSIRRKQINRTIHLMKVLG